MPNVVAALFLTSQVETIQKIFFWFFETKENSFLKESMDGWDIKDGGEISRKKTQFHKFYFIFLIQKRTNWRHEKKPKFEKHIFFSAAASQREIFWCLLLFHFFFFFPLFLLNFDETLIPSKMKLFCSEFFFQFNFHQNEESWCQFFHRPAISSTTSHHLVNMVGRVVRSCISS